MIHLGGLAVHASALRPHSSAISIQITQQRIQHGRPFETLPPGSYWHPIRGMLCIGRSKTEIEFSLHTSLCECLESWSISVTNSFGKCWYQILQRLRHIAIPATLPWQLWHWISEFPQMDVAGWDHEGDSSFSKASSTSKESKEPSAKMCQLPQVPNVPRHDIATLATLLLRCLRSKGSNIQMDRGESGYAETHPSHHPKRNWDVRPSHLHLICISEVHLLNEHVIALLAQVLQDMYLMAVGNGFAKYYACWILLDIASLLCSELLWKSPGSARFLPSSA